MMAVAATAGEWDGAVVRRWLERRVAAARADQVTAQRAGRDGEDDCDKATAEELVCALYRSSAVTDDPAAWSAELRTLLARDDYVARGVYNDARFDRHVRGYIRKLLKMAKTNQGFGNTTHYQ